MEKSRRDISVSSAFDGPAKNGRARSAHPEPDQKRGQKKDQPYAVGREPANPSRRSFLGKVSGAAVAGTASSIMLKPLLGGKDAVAGASVVGYGSGFRARACSNYRLSAAQSQDVNVGVQPDNGDIAEFMDLSAMYSKALLHDSLGLPNARSWSSMKHALM